MQTIHIQTGKTTSRKNFMIPRIHLVGVWSAIAFLIFLGLGMVSAGFLPPHKPTATAAEIVAIYQGNLNGIRFGIVMIIIASGFYLPWTVTLSAMIRRMEGESTFLSQCQLIGGTVATLTFFLPAMVFGVAAFRPERNPDITLMLNDVGWILLFVAPIPPFVVQFLPLGVAILLDKSKMLPRWFGYATIWFITSFLPPLAGFFFKTGPFAWNGLFIFWIPLLAFSVWICILLLMSFKRIQPSSAGKGAAVV
jgi:hypothetical protein